MRYHFVVARGIALVKLGVSEVQYPSSYPEAIASGICLPAAIEELPTRMGLVCARVIIPNRRPHDPLFDILPIEKLVVQYQL